MILALAALALGPAPWLHLTVGQTWTGMERDLMVDPEHVRLHDENYEEDWALQFKVMEKRADNYRVRTQFKMTKSGWGKALTPVDKNNAHPYETDEVWLSNGELQDPRLTYKEEGRFLIRRQLHPPMEALLEANGAETDAPGTQEVPKLHWTGKLLRDKQGILAGCNYRCTELGTNNPCVTDVHITFDNSTGLASSYTAHMYNLHWIPSHSKVIMTFIYVMNDVPFPLH